MTNVKHQLDGNSTSCVAGPAPPVPENDDSWALFLDFDGTLVDIAEHPDQVRVAPEVPELIAHLQRVLGGALAVVTGRSIEAVDGFLGVPNLAVAGLHGLERRSSNGVYAAPPPAPVNLSAVRSEIGNFAAPDPRLHFEDKGTSVSLHYRQAPERAVECARFMAGLADKMDGYHTLIGKMVVELKPTWANKGAAVAFFMDQPDFKNRTAVFVGDDTTDEDGFRMAQARDGLAVKVGPGATEARYRVGGVGDVLVWLGGL